MAAIVNLRIARKRKRRSDAEANASENRIRHGVSAAEKAGAGLLRELRDKRLDGHRRGPDAKDPSGEPTG